MHVYDFDKTVYIGDSTVDFYFFCIKIKPSILFYLPRQGLAFLKYAFGSIDKTTFKGKFFCFLPKINDLSNVVDLFWNNHIKKIKKWYLSARFDDDVIISASPEFLLRPICKQLGIQNLIASEVNVKTGLFNGKNCYGEEKCVRFKQAFGTSQIDEFYSDSLSDSPMAKLAIHSYIVRGNKIIPWEQYKPN